ncbi:tetratricopeptide (TPR) repeat protein [Azospirillum fermentarium]|uniref:tetratricopeptide repeat protein n=1 Tax=Azospirillum fermentarium TaxID=1233114 RepID=UPI00222700EB|nr:tetratricopeptide repeat protein [Azospirillum fermentarium]MCW2246537.1 tetratricopeptide (TPR) repeat protein [Azospirillum fermentarium]
MTVRRGAPPSVEQAAEQMLRSGRLDEAERLCRRALSVTPDSPQALGVLGLVFQRRGRVAEGMRMAGRALATAPSAAAPWLYRGMIHQGLGDAPRAEADFRCALALAPALGEAWGYLGLAVQRRGAAVTGERLQRRAVSLSGPDAVNLFNLACCLEAQGRVTAAEGLYRRAAALRPDMAQVHVNLGYAALARTADSEAEAGFRRAALLMPSLAPAHWNLGLAYLKRGILDAGWRHYEHRFAAVGMSLSFPMPRWNGAALDGRRLVVWREQGLGDELLFASCYPDLERLNSPVTIECDPRLLGLFGRSFPWADLRPVGRPVRRGDADVQIPAGSLPQLCRFRLARVPARTAYLQPDPLKLAWWRRHLAPLGQGRLLVGIGWRSQKIDAYRRNAYTDLVREWGPILTVPGISFVNLQYDDCSDEIRRAEDRWGVPLHRFAHLDLKNDLEGLAALIAALDLVIVPATAAGELAGALGVPVWRLCRDDWTRLGTGTRPWFPSHRVFSPALCQDMGEMLPAVAAALRRLSAGR